MSTYYYDIQQGSPEWVAIRDGKMTASHAQAIGNNGKGLETYITELMASYYSSNQEESFTNKHIERGNELEPVARSIYELTHNVEVKEVGFVQYNDFVGCSPDGLIGEDGGLEIKCVEDTKYFKHLINGESEIDSAYIWQVQMNLLITERKWWDLMYYNPNYEESYCIYKLTPDEEKFNSLLKGFEIGEKRILEIRKKIEDGKGFIN